MRSLEQVVQQVPGRPDRPLALAKTLGLNKDFSSRLMSALRQHDPLAALHTLPGPGPLQQMLDSAQRLGIDAQAIGRASRAVESFAELIRDEFESRSGLDALISATIPDARDRYETTAKQAVYRGQVGVKGISVDTMLVTFVLGPPREGTGRCDSLVVNACYGLRRIRPGAHFELTTTLRDRGERGEFLSSMPILEEFCSPLPLPIETHRRGDQVRYMLDGSSLGHRNPIDLVTTEIYRLSHRDRADDPNNPRRWFCALVDTPAKVLVFDTLIHRDTWVDALPDLHVFDTAISGEVDPAEEVRPSQHIELAERIIELGTDARRFRSGDVPKYTDLLARVISDVGWDPSEFRGYRCRVAYPVYGSQVTMYFQHSAG